MSLRDDLRASLYDRLLTELPVEYGAAVKVGFENQKFEQPKEQVFVLGWIKETGARRASIGTSSKFNRHMGYFILECYIPEDKGMAALWKLCDAASRIFDSQHFTLSDGSYVTMCTPKVVPNGNKDGFYSHIVMCEYWLDAAPQ